MGMRGPRRLSSGGARFSAINGALVGIFSVEYRATGSVQEALVTILHSSVEPLFAIRDFNITPDSFVYKSVVTFDGCGEKLADVTADVGKTFHGYHPDRGGAKIDYIFTNLPCDPARSFTAADEKDGVYLSDHYPVGAFLEL